MSSADTTPRSWSRQVAGRAGEATEGSLDRGRQGNPAGPNGLLIRRRAWAVEAIPAAVRPPLAPARCRRARKLYRIAARPEPFRTGVIAS